MVVAQIAGERPRAEPDRLHPGRLELDDCRVAAHPGGGVRSLHHAGTAKLVGVANRSWNCYARDVWRGGRNVGFVAAKYFIPRAG